MWIEKLTEIQRERCLLAVRAFFCALLLISVFVCVYLCASLPLIACCVEFVPAADWLMQKVFLAILIVRYYVGERLRHRDIHLQW
jgi:hypothetical protein